MADADLRPMSLGEVLDRTFKIYRNHFWLFAGISALPSGVMLIIHVANSAWTTSHASRVRVPGQFPGVTPTALFTGALVAMVFMLVYFVLLGYAQAASVFAVSDLYLGGTAGLRASYRRVGTKALRVLLIFILLGLVVGVGFVLLIIPGIILGIFLGCRATLAVPISMLENTNPVRSIERSIQLTKGHGLEIFVILLMVVVLNYVVILLLQAPFLYLAIVAAKAQQVLPFFTQVLMSLASFVSGVLVGPIATIALSLMYYNLRVRKEAFDIQHQLSTMSANPTLGTPSAV
jgi:hypothetical protein